MKNSAILLSQYQTLDLPNGVSFKEARTIARRKRKTWARDLELTAQQKLEQLREIHLELDRIRNDSTDSARQAREAPAAFPPEALSQALAISEGQRKTASRLQQAIEEARARLETMTPGGGGSPQ